jgi:hypothetical protein
MGHQQMEKVRMEYTVVETMSSRRNIWVLASIMIAVSFLSVSLLASDMNSAGIKAVKEALRVYFFDHGRYFENLDVVFEEYGLRKELLNNIGYGRRHDYGSYTLSYSDEHIHALYGGPPWSEQSHKAKLNELRYGLRSYYREHGRFPRDLYEYAGDDWPELTHEIDKGQYSYSVSEDLQSFTLDSKSSGPVIPWYMRLDLEAFDRTSKIELLAYMLELFYLDIDRYPKDLQEVIDLKERYFEDLRGLVDISDNLRHLIEGEDIIYKVSADGKSAYLDGEDVADIRFDLKEVRK